METTVTLNRAFGSYMFSPRRRVTGSLLILAIVMITIIVLSLTIHLSSGDEMEEQIIEIRSHLHFLESQYRGRQESVISLQAKILTERGNETPNHITANGPSILSPEVMALLKNMSGTKSASGVKPKPVPQLKTPFVYQLLPHLMNDSNSLTPAYHLQSNRRYVEVVIGIPTVKRDKDNYLMQTLKHLISSLSKQDKNTSLIVIMIGEVDLAYVLSIARKIETEFPDEVKDGLIEIISPSPAYYPDFENIPTSLGDSFKRVKWRTKQNLDTIYLMSFCQSRGAMYLMLEDDVIAKNGFMKEIKKYTAEISLKNPSWFFIDYCNVGGIGKLFKTPDLVHFIIYVELFYTKMPIDWLLESYLANRICSIDKTAKVCGESKIKIRPKYKTSLFQHIGLYSSLKGKIQKVKDSNFKNMPPFYPHKNPPIKAITSDIAAHSGHTLIKAYHGHTYFWGMKPKRGDVIEFWFKKPTYVSRFLFRSGNVKHVCDKLYNTDVQILYGDGNFTTVGSFDEFGLAEGKIDKEFGPLNAIRLAVNKNSKYWVIISELRLTTRSEYIGITSSTGNF